MIALRNLMHALEDHDPRIIQALECAIDDNANGIAMEDTASTLQAYLKNTNDPELNQHVQTLLESLENTEPYKKSLAKQIEQIHRQFYEALDFSEVKGNVVLVHGADDNTIVAQSSLDLHAHLQKQNIESTVLITPLIESHSSYKPSLKSAWDFVQLTQTIGSFFKKTG